MSGIWVRLLSKRKMEHVDLDNKPVLDIVVKTASSGD